MEFFLNLLLAAIVVYISIIVYRFVKNSPELFTRKVISDSLFNFGVIGIGVMLFIFLTAKIML